MPPTYPLVSESSSEDDGVAVPTTPKLTADAGCELSTSTDYGSDLDSEDETLLGDVLSQIAATAPKTIIYPSIEDDTDATGGVVIHQGLPSAISKDTTMEASPNKRVGQSPSVEVEYDRQSREVWSVPRDGQASEERPMPAETSPAFKAEEKYARSPLQQFRTKPKKPLSVTDLVSPAWCELQHWYILTKFGRNPRTKAMKEGSKVHKVLEEQVHEIVPIQIKTKEDGFGLKICNTIQGLRTLRATGLTRELEVWGIVDGQIVNGIIDEISYTCPDPAFEEALEKSKAQQTGGTLPLGQLSIMRSFDNAQGNASAWAGALGLERMIYITEVKTRGVKSKPVGASLRPTWMQLMLYRKLLESLALNTVDAGTVFARYNLQPLVPFTETFISEVGDLDFRKDMVLDDEIPFSILQPSTSELETHNNLSALWSLMISEFSQAIDTFSDVLRAEFRYSKTGAIIGSEVVAYNASVIDEYLAVGMSWWKGEREAKGVEIEEAFKCRVCDFAEDCTWRKNKVEEATEKHRLRAAAREKSAM
ncbi:hypothetical protein K469DRAFT_545666 [Zopfia rhizophila CBS 207.26]|uniref:Exonuclease V n=1 Tax=Zopfia rhizophila CBS 207.26 TaxID=1314779 RepID=A0A6A6EUE8_9PEZI|nr:hypothetical protein K469DRAFT_545666 [Zopfia rhizophila CBS 207.26]